MMKHYLYSHDSYFAHLLPENVALCSDLHSNMYGVRSGRNPYRDTRSVLYLYDTQVCLKNQDRDLNITPGDIGSGVSGIDDRAMLRWGIMEVVTPGRDSYPGRYPAARPQEEDANEIH